MARVETDVVPERPARPNLRDRAELPTRMRGTGPPFCCNASLGLPLLPCGAPDDEARPPALPALDLHLGGHSGPRRARRLAPGRRLHVPDVDHLQVGAAAFGTTVIHA